jgi:hypothetical protein
VDGISDMVECGRGLLFGVYMSLFFYVTDRVWLGVTLWGCGEGVYGCSVGGSEVQEEDGRNNARNMLRK